MTDSTVQKIEPGAVISLVIIFFKFLLIIPPVCKRIELGVSSVELDLDVPSAGLLYQCLLLLTRILSSTGSHRRYFLRLCVNAV